ncbi:MAG: hypothetical protein CMK59_05870 [Proteobacteria bacterium]|nr:hypothetical protein [Pseudomonadota bacterium]
MKAYLAIIPVLFCACGTPNIEYSSSEDAVDSEDNINLEEDNSDNNLDEDEKPVSEEDLEEGTSGVVLVSEIWEVVDATLVEDTCDWDTQLRQFFGVGADALLPTDFTVEGFEGGFEIEANAYGASGPIECTLNDLDFRCETQSVTPLDFDLGSYGWTYAIEFSGVVNNENSLDGTAVVSFPTVSDILIPVFEAMQVDVSQCTQTFELSIDNIQ